MSEFIKDATSEVIFSDHNFINPNIIESKPKEVKSKADETKNIVAIPINKTIEIKIDSRNPQSLDLQLEVIGTGADKVSIDGSYKQYAIVTIANPSLLEQFDLTIKGSFAGGRPIREDYKLPVMEGRNFYTLTVNSGAQTGAGEYLEGTGVPITADDPPAGKVFDNWTSNNGGTFGNNKASNTIFTMPESNVTVTANYDDEKHDITLSPTSTHIFAELTYGYKFDDLLPLKVSVTNSGNVPDTFTATLSGANADSFELFYTGYSNVGSSISAGYLEPGSNLTTAFEVSPKTGLGAGTYTATVTVTGTNGGTANFDVSFEVKKATPSVTAWPTSASAITYGQALSASTLSGGAASVSGTFTWSSPTVVPASAQNYTYTVLFEPADTANYNSVTLGHTVLVTVNKKYLTIVGATHTKPYDGTTKAEGITSWTFSGYAGSDTAADVSVSGYNAEYTNADAGTKTISISSVTFGGAKGANYRIPLGTHTLTVAGIYKATPTLDRPGAPAKEDRTADSVIIGAVANPPHSETSLQYAINTVNEAPQSGWKTSREFTGLAVAQAGRLPSGKLILM